MTTSLDTIRYHSGIAGEEVADMVDSLEQEVSTLREQVEKLTEESVVLRASSRSKLETISSLELQVEKLTKERDDLRSRRCEVCGYLEHEREHTGCLREQLAALAGQNEKLKEATNLIYSWANNWDSEFMNDPDWLEQDYPFIQSTISLPDLASPVLNRIRAEGMRMASTFISLVRNDWASAGDNLSAQAAEYLISALDTRADELEKTNG